MPRNVRNFWIDLDVDGRQTAIATGPQSKTGGFQLTVKVRDNGAILRALCLSGWVDGDGKLRLGVTTTPDAESRAKVTSGQWLNGFNGQIVTDR